MRRAPLTASITILLLLLVACSETAVRPTAGSAAAGTRAKPASRAAAMEQPEPCPRRWPVPACPGQEETRVRTAAEIYYLPIDAARGRFQPGTVVLSISHQIELINNDPVRHNVTIPASGISIDVEPGANDYTRPITLRPGTYEFYCRFHRADGMRGVLSMTSSKDIVTTRRGY